MEFKNIKQIKKKLQFWRHTTGLIMCNCSNNGDAIFPKGGKWKKDQGCVGGGQK